MQTEPKQFCEGGVSCAFLRQKLEGVIFFNGKCGTWTFFFPETLAEAGSFRSLFGVRENSAAFAVVYNWGDISVVAQNGGLAT